MRTRLARQLALSAISLLAAACAFPSPSSAALGWQTASSIPGSSQPRGGDGDTSASTVGLADNGAAAVTWVDNASDVEAATRATRGGAWTVTQLAPGQLPIAYPILVMDGKGDAAVAWIDNINRVDAIYKPAGGGWESQVSHLGTAAVQFSLSVAMNSAGQVIVAWEDEVAGPSAHIRAALRTAAGSWPGSAETVATAEVDGADVGQGIQTKNGCGGTAAAIDNSGNARVVWDDPYGSFDTQNMAMAHQIMLVCGERSAARSSGTWGSPQEITDRPGDGTYDRTSAGTVPTAGGPQMAFDHATGKVVVAYPYVADAIQGGGACTPYTICFKATGDSVGLAYGTVSTSVTAGTSISGNSGDGLDPVAVGAGPGDASLFTTDTTTGSASGAIEPFGTSFGVLAALSADSSSNIHGQNGFTNGGGDGTAFFVYRDGAGSKSIQAWTKTAGGSLVGPTPLATGTDGRAGGVAADCAGNALAAFGTGSTVSTVDYVTDHTGSCGGHKLTVTRAGSGSGTVTGPGISCPGTCAHTYASGTPITLAESPRAGSKFVGWSGACTGVGACDLTMGSDRSVTATFKLLVPNTRIANAKIKKKKHTARFTFTSAPAGATFECSLRKSGKSPRFKKCTSPKAYKKLKKGSYVFEVRAVNAAGPDPSPATKSFQI